jgi:hypothetical protein
MLVRPIILYPRSTLCRLRVFSSITLTPVELLRRLRGPSIIVGMTRVPILGTLSRVLWRGCGKGDSYGYINFTLEMEGMLINFCTAISINHSATMTGISEVAKQSPKKTKSDDLSPLNGVAIDRLTTETPHLWFFL